MTEIPEHLLKRSKAARAKAGGESGDAGGEAAPAAAEKSAAPAAPAKAAAPAAPPPPKAPEVKPDSPTVAAFKKRKKIPVWAMMTLSLLPVWAFMYARALTPQEHKAAGPLGEGATVYASACASCHMADGSGAAGGAYGFTNGDAHTTFPHIEDQLRWVELGSAAYVAAGVQIAGDPNREGGPHIAGSNGVMPAQGGNLTPAQLLAVVCHERFTLGGVAAEGDEYTKWCADDSAAWTAVSGGTAIAELHTAVDGALEIGNAPKAGTTKG